MAVTMAHHAVAAFTALRVFSWTLYYTSAVMHSRTRLKHTRAVHVLASVFCCSSLLSEMCVCTCRQEVIVLHGDLKATSHHVPTAHTQHDQLSLLNYTSGMLCVGCQQVECVCVCRDGGGIRDHHHYLVMIGMFTWKKTHLCCWYELTDKRAAIWQSHLQA